MKKFLINGIIAFLLITLLTFIATLYLQIKNSEKLKASKKVELIIKDNKIEEPQTSQRALANYEFSKVYFTIKSLLIIIIPLLFVLNGGVKLFLKDSDDLRRLIKIIIVFMIFQFILFLPLYYFSSFYRLKLVGLSNESILQWFTTSTKEFMLDTLFTVPVYIIIYLIYKKFMYWYIIIGVIAIPFTFISSSLYPVIIDPLFYTYRPLEKGRLSDSIEALADKAGIKNLKILVVDKSKETSALNAYMTGVMGTNRIVLWDTTLNTLSEKEILSIVAHEIGHYKLSHISKAIFLGSLFLIVLLFIGEISVKIIFKKSNRDLESFIYVLYTVMILNLLSSPVENWFSRKNEIDADKFAIELTKDNLTNGILEVRFMESNLSVLNVNKFYKWMVYSHPTVKERIELSNNYKPWENGEYEFKRYIKE